MHFIVDYICQYKPLLLTDSLVHKYNQILSFKKILQTTPLVFVEKLHQ